MSNTATNDPSSDLLRHRPHPLDAVFNPKTVAVIGATEKPGAVGRTVLWNLVSSPFGGTVYPVTPTHNSVLGIKAYKSVLEVPDKIDLVVIVTPAKTVPGIIKQCVQAGVKAAVIISAGFKELGPDGAALEQQVLAEAKKGSMRIIGPNCLGSMCPLTGINATFAAGMARKGSVAFLSQSGALGCAVLDWSFKEMVGFSAFVSIGSMLDVDWGDLIDYLGNDPRTESIVIYMESIGNARSFLSAAREVALTKPIIVIKAGRTAAAAKAAASHTGSLTGSDSVLDAAFKRCGVLRVTDIAEVFHMAETLAKQPRPKGPRLTILTNAGGPGVLATDALITAGGELATLSQPTMDELDKNMPFQWSHGNPIDVLGDALPDRYVKALQIAANDPDSDGLLVVLTPQSVTDPTGTAEALKPYAHIAGKPVLASWMGGPIVKQGADILTEAGIPTFPHPDDAARAFFNMWRFSYNLKGLYETPTMPAANGKDAPDRALAEKIIHTVRESGRTILTEFESKQLLNSYGIPTVPTEVARSESEAVALATKMGFPIVAKIFSETITHKTDVGGVKLNLRDAAAVKAAFQEIKKSVTEKVSADAFQGVTIQPMVKLDGYEIIIGSSLDSQFGPVMLFGMGGQLVEVFKDSALALPPLTATLARRLMEQTKIYKALKGVRGRKPVDLAALEQLLVRFSQLIVEQRWIKEIDINPLIASPERLLALDARVVVQEKGFPEDKLPIAAIRPYPMQYVGGWKLKNGTAVTIRPVRPEDEPMMAAFHKGLSERSVKFRYLHPISLGERVDHERLTRVCFTDYDREISLVAEVEKGKGSDHEILGIARLSKLHGTNEAGLTVLVSDQWQHQGLGQEFLHRLMAVARDEKLSTISADILPENVEMLELCKKAGFKTSQAANEPTVHAELSL